MNNEKTGKAELSRKQMLQAYQRSKDKAAIRERKKSGTWDSNINPRTLETDRTRPRLVAPLTSSSCNYKSFL